MITRNMPMHKPQTMSITTHNAYMLKELNIYPKRCFGRP